MRLLPLVLAVACMASPARADDRAEARVEGSVRATPVEHLRLTADLELRVRTDRISRIMPGLTVDYRLVPHLRVLVGYTYVLRIDEAADIEHGHRVHGGLTGFGRVDDVSLSFRTLAQWRLMGDSTGDMVGDRTVTYLRNRFAVDLHLGEGRTITLSAEHYLQILDVVDHARVRATVGFAQEIDDVEWTVALTGDFRGRDERVWFLSLGVRWSPEALAAE